MQSVWAEVLTLHPSVENHLLKKGLLSPSTPHGLRQGALLALLGVFQIVSQLDLPCTKIWGEKISSKKHENML